MTKKDFFVIAKIIACYEQAFYRATDAEKGEKAYNHAFETADKLLQEQNENYDSDKFWSVVEQYQDNLIDTGF